MKGCVRDRFVIWAGVGLDELIPAIFFIGLKAKKFVAEDYKYYKWYSNESILILIREAR